MAPKKTPTKRKPVVARQRREGSVPEQLDALLPGQSVSFSKRIALADAALDPNLVNDTLVRMRSTAHTSLQRIIDEAFDTRQFVNESYVALNDAKTAVLCVVNVHRES